MSEVQQQTSLRPAPRVANLYLASHHAVRRFHAVVAGCFAGVWLGVLNRDQLHAATDVYYARESMYHTSNFNQRGLWDWERRMLEQHFAGCRKLLVASVGGGREVLALRQMDFDATGFECQPDLVEHANAMLAREGFVADIQHALPDQCLSYPEKFDGLILGWGAYSHIRGRSRRIEFLKKFAEQAHPGAPLLVSFLAVNGATRRLKLTAAVGNGIGRFLGRERVEFGDDLAPVYAHHFDEAQVALELQAAGFGLVHFRSLPYGHAVGVLARG